MHIYSVSACLRGCCARSSPSLNAYKTAPCSDVRRFGFVSSPTLFLSFSPCFLSSSPTMPMDTCMPSNHRLESSAPTSMLADLRVEDGEILLMYVYLLSASTLRKCSFLFCARCRPFHTLFRLRALGEELWLHGRAICSQGIVACQVLYGEAGLC